MPRTAKKVPGVVKIVEIPAPPFPLAFQPSGGIAVVADNTWAAIKGRKALKITWDDGPHATYDFEGLSRGSWRRRRGKPGEVVRSERRLRRRYGQARTRKSRPNITSRTSRMRRWSRLRRPCRIVDGKAEVWTSVQSPQAAHDLGREVRSAFRPRTSPST